MLPLTDSCLETPAGGVREPCLARKNYIFAKTWNNTCALKYNSKMLTDEIMDQIEMRTGVPKKQQRITHESKQLATRQTLKHHTFQENDTD